MADPNTRSGKRTPVTLKIKFKSETLEQFIERYAVDVSQGGIFIRTKEPLAVGTQMKFEFQLRDASPLIAGEGTVVWTRENDPSRPAIAPGMGVRFDKLAEGSQAVLEKILAEKQKQAPSRGGNEATTKPPMFTDTPTKVAPAPVQEALGVGRPSGRRREDSEQTPLPKPMPFHSDAEDFDERAFEEATKVRSLDELVAQTAGDDGAAPPPPADDTKTATKLMPPDELAARRQQGRADSTLADPPLTEPPAEAFGAKTMPDRDSAPGLPPSPDGPRPRMLDSGNGEEFASRTLAGHEPAKAATSARMKADSSGARAVENEAALPAAPKRPSSAPIIVGILLVVAGAIVAIYFLFLKEQTPDVATNKGSASVKTDKGSAHVDTSGGSATTMATGSNTAGSAAQGSASTGSASGTTMAAGSAAHPVDTVIAATGAKGATVAIEGTDMTGAAPFTAKLEKDKDYKAKISAAGFVAQEIDVKGGQKEITTKLVAKPRLISVTSTPAGADIVIDGVPTQKLTPADVTLSATQAARAKVHVTLRRPGYRPLDQVVDASTYTEDDAKLTATINATLTIAPKVVPNNNGGGTTTTTNNAGSGSAATPPTGNGSGSAATPTSGGTTGGTTPGGGTGSASSGTSGGSTPGGTTPPAGGTTPPAGGTGGTTTPPAGGASGTTSGSASSSGQVLK